jgi:hypothetical protein
LAERAELAQVALKKIAENAFHDVATVVDVIIEYLRRTVDEARSEVAGREPGKPWRRWFFREWLLCEAMGYVFRIRGVGGFSLLRGRDWYRLGRLGLRGPIRLEMEREANIALGCWYRGGAIGGEETDKKHEGFMGLIRSLVRGGDARDREIAFHIIRHTEATEGEVAVAVGPQFKALLKAIRDDSRLVDTVRGFREFFELNLGQPNRQ